MAPTPSDGSRKADSPQAVIQRDAVGFYPVNSLGLSALWHGQAQAVLASPTQDFVTDLRRTPQIKLGSKHLDIEKKLFPNFSDAFYRGHLPEVVVVTGTMLGVPLFLTDYMDFLEKLCSLGFLTQEASEDQALLDRSIPNVVVAAYGIVYDVMMDKLRHYMEGFQEISPRQKTMLLQKFSRGLLTVSWDWHFQTYPDLKLLPKPLALHLAGPKSKYTLRVTQIMAQVGLPATLNPNGDAGVLELELGALWSHLRHALLPGLGIPKKQLAQTEKSLKALLDAMGRQAGLLPGVLEIWEAVSSKSPYVPSMLDVAIVHQLQAWGRAHPTLAPDLAVLQDLQKALEARQASPAIV